VVEFYPSFPMKAAMLLVRLTKNHALPDGNKPTALALTIALQDMLRRRRSIRSSQIPAPPRDAEVRQPDAP
jgi:Fic/DOC family